MTGIRASAGTVAVLRGQRVRETVVGGVAPTTAYLLEGERCRHDCAFCPQARGAASRGDLLSRINWPEVEGSHWATSGDFLRDLGRAWTDGRLRRACFQVTGEPGALEAARAHIEALRAVCPRIPVSVSVAARDLAEVEIILGWGVDRVGLALDAVTAELHARVKDGRFNERLALLEEVSRRRPGRVATHVIAGLGESEEEMVSVFQRLINTGVGVALFAFTPVEGTRLAGRLAPRRDAYRRLQVALWLIRRRVARAQEMSFNAQGELVSYGLPWSTVARLPDVGEAFRTSGCPDCNRPYYNERPSEQPYNYPRPLTGEELRMALAEAAGPARWRRIKESRPREAAANMAVDEAILTCHGDARTPPTLRFYTWDPPAVSLGYFQDASTEVDGEACRREGVQIVRRLTGGRAVLHEDEVTYSLVVSDRHLPGSVTETYRRIAEGLVMGLTRLGYRAELAPAGDTRAVAASPGACFEVPSSYEILVGGRKVVGSAQTRRHGVILQHGSILIRLSPSRLATLLGLGVEAVERIRSRAAGLAELPRVADGDSRVLGSSPPGYDEVCRAISEGLAIALGVMFDDTELLPEEEALAARLERDAYAVPDRPAAERASKTEAQEEEP